MKKSTISFRADKTVEDYINEKSKEMNLSRTEFIINAVMNENAVHIDERKEVVKGLVNLSNIIAEIERRNFYTEKEVIKIKEGIDDIWHMLR